MQKRTKFSIIFITTFFILIIIAFIYANKWTKDFQKVLLEQGSVDHATVKDVVITETKDSIKDWEVYSALAEYDNNKVTAIMHDIVGNYYKNGEVVMSFTAPKGTYNSETKKIELLEAVKVIGKGNIKLTADKLSWVTTEDKVYAEGNVIVNKNDEIIAISDKGSVTKDFKEIEIMDNAELRVYKQFKNQQFGSNFGNNNPAKTQKDIDKKDSNNEEKNIK